MERSSLKVAPVEIRWHPGLSIFASESFLRAAGDAYGWLGGFDESGAQRCILPYTVVRKLGIRMARFRVETIPLEGGLEVEEERSFLDGVVAHFRSTGIDLVLPATNNAIFRTYPSGASAAPYGTYVLDLTQSESVLWARLHSKHRNGIRSAAKNGVEIQSGIEYLAAAHQLIRATLKRSRMAFKSYDDFTRYVSSFGENVMIFVAAHRGAPQGCAVIPFSEHSAYYVYGGTAPDPVTGAMNLLQWEAIRHFQSLGVRRYNFVGVRIDPEKGSKQEGLKMFKERFGGQLLQGYMWKYPLRPVPSAVYSLAVRWLRGGDIVDREHHKLAAAGSGVGRGAALGARL